MLVIRLIPCLVVLLCFRGVSTLNTEYRTDRGHNIIYRSPIKPNAPLSHESIRANDLLIFPLGSVDVHTTYEVRVSYPATTPADFSVNIVNCDDISKLSISPSELEASSPSMGVTKQRLSRSLLNIHKIIVSSDEAGTFSTSGNTALVDGSPVKRSCVTVKASLTGVPVVSKDVPDYVGFDIILEPVLYGIPEGAFRLMAFGIPLLVVVLWCGVDRVAVYMINISMVDKLQGHTHRRRMD